jgi:hypothetical protein
MGRKTTRTSQRYVLACFLVAHEEQSLQDLEHGNELAERSACGVALHLSLHPSLLLLLCSRTLLHCAEQALRKSTVFDSVAV